MKNQKIKKPFYMNSYVELHDHVYGFKPRNINRLSLSQIEKRYNQLAERA